jgi:hypothetical protein
MSFPFFDFFVNGYHRYEKGGYEFSFLYQINKTKLYYKEPITLSFLNKSIVINQDTLDEPVLSWVSVFDCSPHRVDLKKRISFLKTLCCIQATLFISQRQKKKLHFIFPPAT